MDIWKDAAQMILDRLSDEKRIWTLGDINLETTPPARTDAGETTTEFLAGSEGPGSEAEVLEGRDESHASGEVEVRSCWGCGFEPPNKEHGSLSWTTTMPKAGRAARHDLDNRSILCRPCNGREER